MKRIGYMGPPGTFTQEAAHRYAGETPCQWVEYASIPELIYGANGQEVEEAVVPIENSLEGTVNVTIDMLVHEVDLKICGEWILPIRHYLLAPSGVELGQIQVLLSHPQALAQCRKFIHSYMSRAELRAVSSTAGAARQVIESGQPWGAIATPKAAEVFGLSILKKDIQDHQENSTRFVILSKREASPTGCDKTSIAFTVDHRPGSLYHALKIFADHDINLTKIESRPMKTLLGQYLFLVDFDGHRQDDLIQDILEKLSRESSFFMVLGSYPRFKYSEALGG